MGYLVLRALLPARLVIAFAAKRRAAGEAGECFCAPLSARWAALSGRVNSCAAYAAQLDEIADFYRRLPEEALDYAVRARASAARWAREILDASHPPVETRRALDALQEKITAEIRSQLCTGLLKTMLSQVHQKFEGGVLHDWDESTDYESWDRLRRKNQAMWRRARAGAGEICQALQSDIDSFFFSLKQYAWSCRYQRAAEEIARFEAETDRLRPRLDRMT